MLKEFFMKNQSNNKRGHEYVSYNDAKEYAQSLKFMRKSQWIEHCDKGLNHPLIPNDPKMFYLGEWEGWSEFLDSKGALRYSMEVNYETLADDMKKMWKEIIEKEKNK
jgi:hypothetical protein